MNDRTDHTVAIRYSFSFRNGDVRVFDLAFRRDSLEIMKDRRRKLPSWTALEFHQCPHCPLSPRRHAHCPMAVNLVPLVESFETFQSCEEIHLEVTTERRTVSKETSLQRAVSSLMGILIATCGCPHSVFFRPMAVYHLPLASIDETIYRAASTYLLIQYFSKKEGKDTDFELEGLRRIYDNMHLINLAIARRFHEAAKTDSPTNAVVLLDMLAQAMPVSIDESLPELRNLFVPFFAGTGPPAESSP